MDNPLVQIDPGLYIWSILTFLGLLFALKVLAWGPLMTGLRNRQESIARALDDAQTARRELEQLHVESARILAEARVQAEAILSRTREDANRFREEMKGRAQGEAAAIVRNAEKQIELETARAIQQIRHEAVDLSVAIASKLLQRHVSRDDNERLIEETFRQLETTSRPS